MKNIAIYIVVSILTFVASAVIKNEILIAGVRDLFSAEEIHSFRVVNYSSVGVETIISVGVFILVFALAYFLLLFFTTNHGQPDRDVLNRYAKAVRPFFYGMILCEVVKIGFYWFGDTAFVTLFFDDPERHAYESAIFEHTQ